MPDELDALRTAVKGLLYPSDSDEPFDVFTLPATASAKDALVAQGKANGKIEEVPFDQFFKELADSDDAEKFANLKRALSAALSDIHIFRVGQTTIDIYVAGKTKSGAVGGVHTKSVET